MIRLFLVMMLLASSFLAKELDKVTLQLNWKYQFEFAGFIAAKEMGFYKKNGLDVTIQEFHKGVHVIEDVQNQKVDFGVYSASLLRSYTKEKPVVLLANYFKRSALVFITKQDIITPVDLVGRKIMAAPNELETSALGLLLEKFRIDQSQYETVRHSFSAKEFIEGNVDAMTAYISNEPFHLQEEKVPYNILDPMNYGVYGFGVNLFTSYDKTKNNPKQVEAFIKATNQGWVYALKNQKKIVDIIYEKYSNYKSKEALLFEARETEKLMLPKIYPIGYIDKVLLQNMMNNLKQNNLLSAHLTPDDVLFKGSDSANSTIILTNEQEKYIKEKRTIKMCIDPDWMPYEKLENGKHIGMTSDFFAILQKRLGIPVELVETSSWSESIRYVKDGDCDILSLAMETTERLKYLNFTKPYLNFPLVIATQKDKMFISNVESIVTKEKIGIVKGYAIGEILKYKYPEHQIVDVATIKQGLDMVEKGELFGFIDALPTVAYTLQHHYLNSLKIAGKLEQKLMLGIGVRKDEPLLRDILEKAVLLVDEGEKQDILNRYISVTFEKGFDYSLLWKIALAVMLLVAFGTYRHRQLVKHNQALTLQKDKLNRTNETLLETQEQLKASLNSFELLLNAAMEAIVVSKNGVCIDANDVAAKMIGYESKEEIIGLSLEDVIHVESISEALSSLRDDNIAHELKAKKRNGEVFDLLVQGKNAVINGEEVRISLGIDITEMKNQERLLFQQSKMAAMGEMIDNIAHQWRQPLSVISSISTGLCLQHELPDFDRKEAISDLSKLNKTAQHLSETIDDFRNFFRRNKTVKPFEVLHVIKKNLTLIEGILKNNSIKVVFEQVDDVEIKSFENELTQALLNIFYNAKDAMKAVDNRYIFINILDRDTEVIIKIRDTGGGIHTTILDKIFEPYFTTKHQSQGTGIGLYMTHQIIESHMKGSINVSNSSFEYENKRLRGAEFIIKLPYSIEGS